MSLLLRKSMNEAATAPVMNRSPRGPPIMLSKPEPAAVSPVRALEVRLAASAAFDEATVAAFTTAVVSPYARTAAVLAA
ncbi:hypothetical protein D3C80_2033130 [compost metagenome]